MSTATMDAPSAPMQVEDDVSIGGSSASKDPANKAEEASAKPADKRKFCAEPVLLCRRFTGLLELSIPSCIFCFHNISIGMYVADRSSHRIANQPTDYLDAPSHTSVHPYIHAAESALKSFLSGGVGGELRFIDKKVAHVVLDLVNLRPIT